MSLGDRLTRVARRAAQGGVVVFGRPGGGWAAVDEPTAPCCAATRRRREAVIERAAESGRLIGRYRSGDIPEIRAQLRADLADAGFGSERAFSMFAQLVAAQRPLPRIHVAPDVLAGTMRHCLFLAGPDGLTEPELCEWSGMTPWQVRVAVRGLRGELWRVREGARGARVARYSLARPGLGVEVRAADISRCARWRDKLLGD